jgi:hypothetical protein
LDDGFYGLGGIILAEGLHECGKLANPLLNYTQEFALKLSKSMENFSQGSRVVSNHSLRRHGCLSRSSLDWPAEHQPFYVARGWLQSTFGRHKCLPCCRTKRFPA